MKVRWFPVELYPYQQKCLDAIEAARQDGATKALIVMATGLGKTVISAVELRRLLHEKHGRVLYLAHKNDILRQAHTMYESILGNKFSYGYFHGEEKHLHTVDVLFASFQTMANWREAFLVNEFRYIVVDEVHHVPAETYRPTVEYFAPGFMIGLTATPERGDAQDITLVMGEPVFQLGLFEALAEGYLSRVDYRLMTDEIQNREVLDSSVGKLSIAKLNRTIFIPKRDEEIIRIIDDRTAETIHPRTVIFCASITHAEHMEELMPHALLVHSKLPSKVRQQRIEEFRKSRGATVITVDMFNEGIDIPEANVIVFLRSTASRTIFLQQLGRGLRRYHGKEKVLVLDFVANCERVEMIDYVRSGVEKAIDRIGGRESKETLRENFELSIDGAEFDERLIDLPSFIRSNRLRYTKEELVETLLKVAQELGRTPTQLETLKYGMVSSAPFVKQFGSYNKALEAADLKSNREMSTYKSYASNFSREDLIEQIRFIARKLRRTPFVHDLNDYHDFASAAAFRSEFGSWRAALEAAGFQTDPTEGEILALLRALGDVVGRPPRVGDLWRCRPSLTQAMVIRVCGSWNNAVEAAGFPRPKERATKSYTEDDLVAQLRALSERLGRVPTHNDVEYHPGKTAHLETFRRRFGSWHNALKAAGLR